MHGVQIGELDFDLAAREAEVTGEHQRIEPLSGW